MLAVMSRIRGEKSFVKNSEGGDAAMHEGRKSPKYIRHLRKIYGLLREANGETSLLTHHIGIYINIKDRKNGLLSLQARQIWGGGFLCLHKDTDTKHLSSPFSYILTFYQVCFYIFLRFVFKAIYQSFQIKTKKARLFSQTPYILWHSSSTAKAVFSLRLGHARGKTILNRFLMLSRRYATFSNREGYAKCSLKTEQEKRSSRLNWRTWTYKKQFKPSVY